MKEEATFCYDISVKAIPETNLFKTTVKIESVMFDTLAFGCELSLLIEKYLKQNKND